MIKLHDSDSGVLKSAQADAVPMDEWRNAGAPVGATVLIPNDAGAEDIAFASARAGAIVLEFPAFTDGRAYSQAQMLRRRFGFKGDLRARGNILRDQALFMRRSGFTSLEVDEAAHAGFLEALSEFTCFYQPAADETRPAWRARAERACAA